MLPTTGGPRGPPLPLHSVAAQKSNVPFVLALTFSRNVSGSITSRFGPNDTAYSHAISSTSNPTWTFLQPRSSVSSVSVTRAKRPAKPSRSITAGDTQNVARYFDTPDLNVEAD